MCDYVSTVSAAAEAPAALEGAVGSAVVQDSTIENLPTLPAGFLILLVLGGLVGRRHVAASDPTVDPRQCRVMCVLTCVMYMVDL